MRTKPLCAECGDPTTYLGWCEAHRPAGNDKNSIWAKSCRRRREKAGLCLRCGQPAIAGRKYCVPHQQAVDRGLQKIGTVMARKIVHDAKERAKKNRDKESIFLSPDFVNFNPEFEEIAEREKE